jgi:Protein of unknown function (DUF2510)
MSMPTSPPGWYPDPNGAHQLRYFDGSAWTEHVSDNGLQSVSPLAPTPTPTTAATVSPAGMPSATPGPNRRGRAKWVMGGVALVAVAAVVIGVLASGGSDDNTTASGDSGPSVDSGQSFCDDFNGSWSIVLSGMITAEATIQSLSLNPAFSGGTTDELNAVTQGAQDAGVIAAEAPDDLKAQIQAMADFLQLGLQLEQGDTSVVSQMQGLNISSEDAAYLLGTVPIGNCSG